MNAAQALEAPRLRDSAALFPRVGRNFDAELASFRIAPSLAGFTPPYALVVELPASAGSSIDHSKNQIDLRQRADLRNDVLGVDI